jgi:hypothetical protein
MKRLSYGATPGLVFRCQDGSEVLCEWKRHFISVVKPMSQEKVLLILDGQSRHTLSLAAIEILRKQRVVMLRLLVEVTFFRTLRTYSYDRDEAEGENWAATYCVAFPKAVTMETAMN